MPQKEIGESGELSSSRIHHKEEWIESWQETQSLAQTSFLPSSRKLPTAWPIWGKAPCDLGGLFILSVPDERILMDDGHWYFQEPGEGWKRARNRVKNSYLLPWKQRWRQTRCFFQFGESEIIGNNKTTKARNSKTVMFFSPNIQPHHFWMSALIFLLTGWLHIPAIQRPSLFVPVSPA